MGVTTLLYLHGVGDDGTRRDWWDSLTLAADSPLPGVTVIAPDFSDLITVPTAELPVLPHPPHTPNRAAEDHRRRFRSAQAERHSDLVAAGSDAAWPHPRRGFARIPGVIDAIGEKFVMGFIYGDVGRFVVEEQRRRAVLQRVLSALPAHGDVVIVGHSLGALVALDVIRHLPDRIDVPLLVTAASALARRNLPADLTSLNATFPYDRVAGWINIFNTADPVTRGLPIGLRFPQAIDVSVSAGFAEHALASCLADPGAARLVARSLHEAGSLTAAPTAGSDVDLSHAMRLVSLQLTWHLERIIAGDPATGVGELTELLMARRVIGEGTALRGTPDLLEWDRDHAHILRTRIAEADLPAVLVHLATADPLAGLSVNVADRHLAAARRQVIADLGVPPAWLEVARRSHADAATALRPLKLRRSAPAPEPLTGDDSRLAASITHQVRESLRPLAITESPESRRPEGLGDIRPACRELVARALTAHRLGTPAAGTAERTVLSRLMVLLGEQRVGLAGRPGHERLRAQLRRRAATVAESLSWLARQGVGLEAAR